MNQHLDRIGRPVHVGDVVTHRVTVQINKGSSRLSPVRLSGTVVGFVGKNRIRVTTTTGQSTVWYTDSTML